MVSLIAKFHTDCFIETHGCFTQIRSYVRQQKNSTSYAHIFEVEEHNETSENILYDVGVVINQTWTPQPDLKLICRSYLTSPIVLLDLEKVTGIAIL